jgi:transposase-like protein
MSRISYLDEIAVSIARQKMYMWRAVDGEGEVLEILVQSRHDQAAAVRLLRKLLRRREWKAQGFKSAKSARRFVSVHAVVYNAFNVQRHLICRPTHRQFRAEAHNVWSDATVAAA